jgi:hypothetical protein
MVVPARSAQITGFGLPVAPVAVTARRTMVAPAATRAGPSRHALAPPMTVDA